MSILLIDKEILHWPATLHLICSKMNTPMTRLYESIKNSFVKVVIEKEDWLVQKQIWQFDITEHSISINFD